MATDRLKLYNDALIMAGERFLASLTEDREPRRLLDHMWDNEGIEHCLESGQWKFAMRAVRLDYDTDITPEFGVSRAFLKPTDWRLTSAVCSDEYFQTPLIQYSDEAGYWYADLDIIYVRYVSDDANYGMDLAKWPAKFKDYVASHFATGVVLKQTSDDKKKEQAVQLEKDMLKMAKSHDAMSDPTKFPPPGNWTRSRNIGGSRERRGNRNQLIG